MNSKHLVSLVLAVAGLTAGGLAQARGPVDVQWQVTIGGPLGLPLPPVPVFVPRGVVVTAPAPYQAAYGDGYGYDYGYGYSDGYGDRDRDGIPNRYDRRYNPAWDRDGDGIPNRYDRVYNPRWDRDGDGIPNRYDRVYNPGWDRDGDGIPNRYERRGDRAGHGWRGNDRHDDRRHDRRDDHRDERYEPIGRR